jgi:predicted transcriptional regulator
MTDINKSALSELHIKILRFFHENQASIDTPRGVSTWVREDRSIVSKALEDLVRLNVLNAHRATSTTGYSYTRDPKIISKIEKLLTKRRSS